MGSATRHRRKFLLENPYCIFCGGDKPSKTIEHCPPRAMFKGRLWPEGFEFPSCEACNHGTANDDLLIAMLGHINPFESNLQHDKSAQGIFKQVARQFPGIWQEMAGSANDSRRRNRAAGISIKPGQLHQDSGIVDVPDVLLAAAPRFGAKLTKGIYYALSKRIFPESGCVLFHWFTNEHLIKSGRYPMFDAMEEKFGGNWQPLKRNQTYLDDQFSFRATYDPGFEVLVLQCIFGKSFGFVSVSSIKSGPLEDMVAEMNCLHPDRPLFAIVQSPTTKLSPPEHAATVFSLAEAGGISNSASVAQEAGAKQPVSSTG